MNSKIFFIISGFCLSTYYLIALPIVVYGGSWTQTSDSDFAGGSLSKVLIKNDSILLDYQGQVVAKSETLPTGRKGTSCAYNSSDKKIYIFGGCTGHLPYEGYAVDPLDDIIEYDPLTGTVKKRSETLPAARGGTSAVYNPLSQKIYIFGGYDRNGNPLSDIIEYDPKIGLITKRTETLSPRRSETSAVYDSSNKKIYIFGGRVGEYDYLSDIIEYDPQTGSVTTKAETLPTARGSTSSVYSVSNNKIYIFGGSQSYDSFSDIIEYDPEAGSVIKKPETLPSARKWTSAAYNSSTGKIYIFGGDRNRNPLSDIIEYDPSLGQVVKRSEKLPKERFGTSSCYDSSSKKMYVFGGHHEWGASLSEIVEFSFSSSYYPSGCFISGAKEVGEEPKWGKILWTEEVHFGTDISFQTRVSNDGENWTVWSDQLTEPMGSPILSPSARYIQVKGNFSTAISTETPVLHDFTITYNISSPSAPTNISPSSGESLSWHVRNPTFSWSEFYDADGDCQTAFQVQLRYSTGTYGDPSSENSGEIALSSNTWRPEAWDLQIETSYFWKVRVKDNSGLDTAWSDWSNETQFYIKYNTSPEKPTNIYPSSGEFLSREVKNPRFEWSFYDMDADTQSAFQIQLRYSTGTYGDAWGKDSGEVALSSNTWTPEAWDLQRGTSYFWEVRVKDNSGFDNAWSDWSDETHFYIKYNIPPDEPINTFPASGASLPRETKNPAFSWSAFSDDDGDSQIALRVQLRTAEETYGDGNSKDSGEIPSTASTWMPSDWNLLTGTYYWRVRTKDDSGFDNAWSDWSDETVFYIENNSPILSWTGEPNYENDGLHPETGGESTSFVFRISYSDVDNDAPKCGYPKLHILKTGQELANSPFTMTEANTGDTQYADGKIYAYSITLTGAAYSYWFEAFDIFGAKATGVPTSEKSGPTTIQNPPKAKEMKVYHGVFRSDKDEKCYVSFNLEESGDTTVKIYDSIGREIKTIYSGMANPGPNTIPWDGTDDQGNKVSSGVYIIRINGSGITQQKKVVVIR